MRAGRRVAQKGADVVGNLRGERVLKTARVLLKGLLVNKQDLCKEPFGEPVPAYRRFGKLLTNGREMDIVPANLHQPVRLHL